MNTKLAIEIFETMLEQDFLCDHERAAIRFAIGIMERLEDSVPGHPGRNFIPPANVIEDLRNSGLAYWDAIDDPEKFLNG